MAMVDVGHSSLQVVSQPRLIGLVWRSATTSHVRWTGWTLAMTCVIWQYRKHCPGYYYYYLLLFDISPYLFIVAGHETRLTEWPVLCQQMNTWPVFTYLASTLISLSCRMSRLNISALAKLARLNRTITGNYADISLELVGADCWKQ